MPKLAEIFRPQPNQETADKAELDSRLAGLLEARSRQVASIQEAIYLMTEIDDLLPAKDGLKYFNILYRMVTEQVEQDCLNQKWQSPEWLVHLDVEFAKLYFQGILHCLKKSQQAPKVWQILMENRYKSGLAKVQYGFLGVNAHINRDLMLACVKASENTGTPLQMNGPEEQDYSRINAILDEVEITAMAKMATGSIKFLNQRALGLDKKLAMAAIRASRKAAWLNAQICWQLRSHDLLLESFTKIVDQVASVSAGALLVPTEPLWLKSFGIVQ